MNRAEIRRQKRMEAKADKVYHLTKAQLDQIVLEATNKALDRAMLDRLEQNIVVMLTLPLMSLHDCFGFGKIRTQRLMDNIMLKWESMTEDYDRQTRYGYSFDTFVKLLKDEGVIDIIDFLNKRGMMKRE